MDMKHYINIVEAFGKGGSSGLDKELKSKVPKSAIEILGNTIGVIGGLGGLVAGAVKGISFVSPDALLSEVGYIFAGSFGAALGAALGIIPGSMISGLSKSSRKRENLKKEKVSFYLKNNPTLLQEVDIFVKNLIEQTPRSILKNANYITHIITSDMEEGGEFISGELDKQTAIRVEETKKLIYGYFSQKEKEWEKLAQKYNIDPVTLHQLVNEYGSQDSIEDQWLEGIKEKLTAPTNEEPLEETSDEAIARIVELSKDRK